MTTNLLSFISTLLLGSMLFFTVLGVTPARNLLDGENAGNYFSDLFPRFYLWGITMSGVGMLIALYNRSLAFMLIAIVFGGYVYARLLLYPKIARAWEVWHANDTPQDKAVFDTLYRQHLLVNAIQIVVLGILIFVE